MKKNNVLDILDNVFWYIIYLLPLVAYLISICGHGDNTLTIIEYFNDFFSLSGSNMILTTLLDIFGSDGVFSILDDSSYVFSIVSYFVTCFLIHLAIDVLLFIPRLCHYWMEAFNKTCGGKKQ